MIADLKQMEADIRKILNSGVTQTEDDLNPTGS